MSIRRILMNGLLAVASLIVFLGILEGGSRLLWTSESSGGCFEADDSFGHKLKASCHYSSKQPEGKLVTYKINACGDRAEVDCTSKNHGSYRIFAIGDSFTYGAMVPETDIYLRVAEQWWKAHLPYEVEAYNGGVPAYDLYHYYLKMDTAFVYNPQLILVGLLPNDLFSNLSEDAITMRRKVTKEVGPRESIGMIYKEAQPKIFALLRTVERSRFVHFLTHLLLSNEKVYLTAYLFKSGGEDSFLKAQYSSVWNEKIEQAERIIGQMARRAREHKVQLVIILIPQRVQALLVKTDLTDPSLDAYAFSRKIKNIGERHGVQVFDFLERLSRHPKPIDLYYPVDGHLTPEGQRLLGEFVADELFQACIFPKMHGQGMNSPLVATARLASELVEREAKTVYMPCSSGVRRKA